jgi:hypothetical protein
MAVLYIHSLILYKKRKGRSVEVMHKPRTRRNGRGGKGTRRKEKGEGRDQEWDRERGGGLVTGKGD